MNNYLNPHRRLGVSYVAATTAATATALGLNKMVKVSLENKCIN